MSEDLAQAFVEIGWNVVTAEEYCTSISDGTHDTPKPVIEGFPLYTSKNLTDCNRLDKSDVYNISAKDIADINRRSFVNQYDVLFGMIGTVGNPVIVEERDTTFAVKNVAIFRFGGDVYRSRWFYYCLHSEYVRRQFARSLDGSTQKFVSLGMLRSVRIQVPTDIEVITKTCDLLTSVDNLIEKTEALIAKYQSVKQGLMHDLFTRGVDEYGHLRPPYAEAPALYKETELGWIPKEWEIYRLQDLVRSESPITYGVVQPGPEDSQGVLFVRGGDIFDTEILVSSLRTISQRISENYRRTRLLGGEIVVSLVGYPGEAAIVPRCLAGANIARQAALIRLQECYSATFVVNYLLSMVGKNELFRNSVGSAQQVINLADLKFARMAVPQIEEQEAIARPITKLRARIKAEKAQVLKVKAIKTALMQDLLTGKVRVKVDKEPAANV